MKALWLAYIGVLYLQPIYSQHVTCELADLLFFKYSQSTRSQPVMMQSIVICISAIYLILPQSNLQAHNLSQCDEL